MDLGLYWSVIRRHKVIALVGLFLALALAFLAAFSVSGDGVERRGSAVWEATSTLLVSQPGFPYGRSTLNEFVPAKGSPDSVPRFSDPVRVQYLAGLYAELAKGDDVRVLVRRAVGLPGIAPIDEPKDVKPKYDAMAGRAFDGTPLPTIVISGQWTSEAGAVSLTNAVTESVRKVITRQQDAASIKTDARIVLPVIERADDAKVVEPLRPTRPVMLFLLVLMLTVGVVFVVDNVRRTGPAAVAVAKPAPEAEPAAVSKGDLRRGKERLPSIPATRKPDVEVGGTVPRRRSSAGRAD